MIKTDFAHQTTQDLSKIAAKFSMALLSFKLAKTFRSTEIARNLKPIIKNSSSLTLYQISTAILTLLQIVSSLQAWSELKLKEVRGWPFKASPFLECQLRTSMSWKVNSLLMQCCPSRLEHLAQLPGSKITKIVDHLWQAVIKRAIIGSITLSHLPKSSPFSSSIQTKF